MYVFVQHTTWLKLMLNTFFMSLICILIQGTTRQAVQHFASRTFTGAIRSWHALATIARNWFQTITAAVREGEKRNWLLEDKTRQRIKLTQALNPHSNTCRRDCHARISLLSHSIRSYQRVGLGRRDRRIPLSLIVINGNAECLSQSQLKIGLLQRSYDTTRKWEPEIWFSSVKVRSEIFIF